MAGEHIMNRQHLVIAGVAAISLSIGFFSGVIYKVETTSGEGDTPKSQVENLSKKPDNKVSKVDLAASMVSTDMLTMENFIKERICYGTCGQFDATLFSEGTTKGMKSRILEVKWTTITHEGKKPSCSYLHFVKELLLLPLERVKKGKTIQSMILLGLRGVGKTVLLNEFDQMSENAGCPTAIIEADPNRTLPELLTPHLHRLLMRLDRSKRMGNEMNKAFGFLRSFASAFKVSYGGFELNVSDEKMTGDLTLDLTDLFLIIAKAAKSKKTAAVILIDEVQYLSTEYLSAIITALHKISQRKLPLLFIGAGLPQLAKLAGNAKGSVRIRCSS
jgi:hypothetical protein